jgi:hypothetical protein
VQVPVWHVSVWVQAFASSQGIPESCVTVHVFEPLQARVLQESLVHVSVVPAHVPAPLQASLYVHARPSLQDPLVRGADAHVFVPLQVSVTHVFGLLVHVMPVPTQVPAPLHVSL